MVEFPKVITRSQGMEDLFKGLIKVIGIKFLFDWILILTALYVALMVSQDFDPKFKVEILKY